MEALAFTTFLNPETFTFSVIKVRPAYNDQFNKKEPLLSIYLAFRSFLFDGFVSI